VIGVGFFGPKLPKILSRSQEKHYLVAGGICEEVLSDCGTGICSCNGLAMLAAFWVVSDDLLDIFLLNVYLILLTTRVEFSWSQVV
jgi:hypothetical protein